MAGVIIRGGKKSKRYSGGGSGGGSSTAYNPDLNYSLPISGFSTPIITGHLPPGAITYNANGQIQYNLPQVGGKRSGYSKRSGSKRSRSKKNTKPFWGETLARMAHPRSAVGGARTKKSKRSINKRSRTRKSKKCSWFS